MLNITPICQKYKKRPSHFLDNAAANGYPIVVVRGKGGYTAIPDTLIAEFYCWLSPNTRKQVLSGVPLDQMEHL